MHLYRPLRFLLAGALLIGGVVVPAPSMPKYAVPVQSQELALIPALTLPGAGEQQVETQVATMDLPQVAALGARWEQELPEGASFVLEARTSIDAPWKELRVDHDVTSARDDAFDELHSAHAAHDHDAAPQGTVFAEVLSGRGQTVQLRATLHSTGPAASVRDVTALAYSSRGAFPRAQIARAADGVRIISRSEWGADESLRVYNENNPVAQTKIAAPSEPDPEVLAKLGDEIEIVQRVEKDAEGNTLTWPMETAKKIKKIVIHHTSSADPQSPDDAVAYLRSVYFFHAITRGWGDIGYNYVIDPFGNVYEGRAGGKRVVGAHAANFNIGSIGIAVMGNYGDHDITPESKRSLVALVHQLAAEEGFDPAGMGDFRLMPLPNVIGHRDVGTTACPGDTFYASLMGIRTLSAKATVDPADPLWTPKLGPATSIPTTTGIEALIPEIPERFDRSRIDDLEDALTKLDETGGALGDASYQLRPDPSNPHTVTVKPGEETLVTLRFRNDGSVTLTDATRLEGSFVSPKLRLGDIGGTTVAKLEPGTVVVPGAMASFTFPVWIDRAARGSFSVQLIPIANDMTALPAAAARMRILVDPNAIGLVDTITAEALDTSRTLFVSIAKLPPDAFTPAPRVAAGADVEGTDTVMLADAAVEAPAGIEGDSETAPGAASTLSSRFSLNILPEAPSASTTSTRTLDTGAPVRILLSKAPDDAIAVSGTTSFAVYVDDANRATIPANAGLTLVPSGASVQALLGASVESGSVIRLVPSADGILTVTNWTRAYRGILELRAEHGALMAINEVNLEDYLRGLAEPSPHDPQAKIEALIIAARTYARYYRDAAEKFPGAPYHLDDDPARSQKYVGYTFEERATMIRAAVEATDGLVVTFNGALIKTPYFSASTGRTKSAAEVWGWTDTPYLTSVADPCDAPREAGHGVGLSGCGARVLAEQGSTATQILQYFYPGTAVERLPL